MGEEWDLGRAKWEEHNHMREKWNERVTWGKGYSRKGLVGGA